jgi:predicted ATPase
VPSRIEVKGYKSIREMELDLAPLNILIGANGAGKSNLVQALGLLRQIVEQRLQLMVRQVGGAARLLHKGPKVTEHIGISIWEGSNSYQVLLGFASDDTLFFEMERCTFQRPPFTQPYDVVLGRTHLESRLAEEAALKPNRVEAHVLERVLSWKVYHFHDTSTSAPVKLKGPIDDNATLREDARNLAAFLYRLQQTRPDAYRRIVAAIRLVAPFFQDFALRPDPLKPDSIQLEWIEHDSESYLNGQALSDGTLRFMCLTALLLQPDLPSTVIIDEPELGLHPYAVVQLASMLRAASTRTCVLVATQSVTLMNQFEPEDVVVVEREDGGSVFRRITREEIAAWIDGYALGELWEKNVLGGNPQRP